jgi:hypothetical protein
MVQIRLERKFQEEREKTVFKHSPASDLDTCSVGNYKFFIQECHLFLQAFFCHRSDYFKAFFEFSQTAATNQSPDEDCRVLIHDVTPAVFAVVVAYLYIDDAKVCLPRLTCYG